MPQSKRHFLVTGGAGFIGSAFIRAGLKNIPFCQKIVNLDLLTYAGHLENVKEVENDPRYHFIRGDICDEALVEKVLRDHEIDTIVHFAAESHVDTSITSPRAFFETNVRGTFSLLEVVRKLPYVHFHHVSTDEVFGALGAVGKFTETSPYAPNSPYSASKAASDHFVRAFAHTYGLSTTLSHCTNNYGPYQFPEKFIPRMILNCIEGKSLPVYGDGKNQRDWLYVDDHVEALWLILEKGKKGSVYGVGDGSEMENIQLLYLLIDELALQLGEDRSCFEKLITFVADRPGHDFRYAIDAAKLRDELGWTPRHSLKEGLKETVRFYLNANKGIYAR